MRLVARTARILCLCVAASLGATAAAAACKVAKVDGADALIRVDRKPNARLVDAAIRAEVNFYRCKSGLRALKSSDRLADIAATHASWMARAKTVSHRSQVAGQSTLKARLSSSGIRFRAGSENIGMVHRYPIEGGRFGMTNAAACQFTDGSGKVIGAHSYASLARKIVGYWHRSPGHKANMLDRRVSMTGSGAAFTAKTPYCGQFFVSQNFAG